MSCLYLALSSHQAVPTHHCTTHLAHNVVTPGTTLTTTVMTTDNLTGEGGLLIHGRLCLDNFDRGDLFSQELDRKLSSVVCGVCLAPSRYNITSTHHY